MSKKFDQEKVLELIKAAKKYLYWPTEEYGGPMHLRHHGFCNYPKDDLKWCNCGRSNLIHTISEIEKETELNDK